MHRDSRECFSFNPAFLRPKAASHSKKTFLFGGTPPSPVQIHQTVRSPILQCDRGPRRRMEPRLPPRLLRYSPRYLPSLDAHESFSLPLVGAIFRRPGFVSGHTLDCTATRPNPCSQCPLLQRKRILIFHEGGEGTHVESSSGPPAPHSVRSSD